MTEPMPAGPIAVTGAHGRLGSALVAALEASDTSFVTWSRPDYDLDDSTAADRLVARDRPRLVIHAAGWVDVDGCARDPVRAHRRNAEATHELAAAAAASGADLVLVSTNEVFDGRRADGAGYRETDATSPANPYGASKLAGEVLAAEPYAGAAGRLWIVRTSWLYGRAGNDFPAKILAAARSGGPLRVVDDEVGCPTSTKDMATAILALRDVPPGTYHLAGRDVLSRHAWASDLVARHAPGVAVEAIDSSQFDRPSAPPPWGVLDSSLARDRGLGVRGWSEARADYSPPGAG